MLAKCRSSEVAQQRSVKRGTEWHQNGATNTNGSLQPHLGGAGWCACPLPLAMAVQLPGFR